MPLPCLEPILGHWKPGLLTVSTDGMCWQLKAQPQCPVSKAEATSSFPTCLRSHWASCLPSMTSPCFSCGQLQSRRTRGRVSGKSSSHACGWDFPSPAGGAFFQVLSQESRHSFPGAWGFCGAHRVGWVIRHVDMPPSVGPASEMKQKTQVLMSQLPHGSVMPAG